MNNTWKIIDDFNGNYKINNLGDVFSIPRNGTRGGLLKPIINKDGYMKVILYKNNKPYTRLVHRLVANAFIENPMNKPEVNHLNNNRQDNRVDNLEWCTNRENIDYSHKQNRQNWNRKKILVTDRKNNIRYVFQSQREAARKLEMKQYVINKCLKNKKKLEGWDFEYAK